MSVTDVVNSIFGRGKKSPSDYEAPSPMPKTSAPEIQYVTAKASKRLDAEQKLRDMLPAPIGSDVYAQQPKIGNTRDNEKQVWVATASYSLRPDAKMPIKPVNGNDISQKVAGNAQSTQGRVNTARAVVGRGTGYSPSALEQEVARHRQGLYR